MNKLSDKNPCDICTVDRQIGNPYLWQCECDRCQKPYEWKKECVNRLREYESIGTVEECRAAVEKQRAKKPLSRTHCKDGNHPLSQDIGRCPSCKSVISENMLWCDDCGQKLDWSDTQ